MEYGAKNWLAATSQRNSLHHLVLVTLRISCVTAVILFNEISPLE
jgi:hypothetical protein